VSLLQGLHAPLLGDEAKRSDFPLLAEMGLSASVLKAEN